MPVVMQSVESSAIAKIGYDTDTDVLYIEFRKPQKYPTYEYSGVGKHTSGRFFKARSIGGYYHRIIKPRRQYQTSASGRQMRSILEQKNSGSLIDVALKASREGIDLF